MKKIVLTVAVAVGIAGAVLLSASCNSNKQVKEGEKADVRFLTETSLPDEGASVPTIENKEHKQLPESDARLASSGNELGIKLFELLCKERGNDRNTLLSPISIETVLGMNALALSDEAFAEYRTIMGLPESTKAEEVAGYLKRINAVLATADKNCRYFPANSFWVDTHCADKLVPTYPQNLYSYFDAPTAVLDLRKASSIRYLNKWIERKTYGRIQNMIPDFVIAKPPYSIALNTFFFTAPWAWHSEKDFTKKESFRAGNGQEKVVDMMHASDATLLRYASNEHYECVAVHLAEDMDIMPYEMLLLLPRDGEAPLASLPLTTAEIDALATASQKEPIALSLPRLSSGEETLDLTNAMGIIGFQKSLGSPAIGLERMFDRNFLLDNQSDIKQTLLHQATLKWDEKSVEASAATALITLYDGMNPSNPIQYREVKFNRPFFAVLRHAESGKILILAAINKVE